MPSSDPKLRFVRVLRGTLITLMIALLPCVLLIAYVAQRYLIWVLGVFVAGLLIVRFAFQLWPCPRCGKPFFRSGTWAGPNMFTKRCMHCRFSEAEEAIPSITGANKTE